MSTLVPDSTNNCWFCDFNNISTTTVCNKCGGLTIPTRKAEMKLEWTIQSFDPHTSTFNSAQASLLFASIDALDDQERAAIRIGSGFRQVHTQSQAATSAPKETGVTDKIKIVQKTPPAVMLVKDPHEGKRFTIAGFNEDGETHDYTPEMPNITNWNNDKGGNQVFWNTLNQILDLDTHSPVRKVYLDIFDLLLTILGMAAAHLS